MNPVLFGWTVTNSEPRIRNGQPVSNFFSGDVVAVLGSPSTSQDASISQNMAIEGGCPLQLTFAATSNPQGPELTVEFECFDNGTPCFFMRRLTTLGMGYNTFVYLIDNIPAMANSATLRFIKTDPGEALIDLVTLGVQ